MNKEITLTKEELEEIKDEVKFRTKVMEHLKQLTNIPSKVTALTVSQGFQWFFLSAIILFVLWKQ